MIFLKACFDPVSAAATQPGDHMYSFIHPSIHLASRPVSQTASILLLQSRDTHWQSASYCIMVAQCDILEPDISRQLAEITRRPASCVWRLSLTRVTSQHKRGFSSLWNIARAYIFIYLFILLSVDNGAVLKLSKPVRLLAKLAPDTFEVRLICTKHNLYSAQIL